MNKITSQSGIVGVLMVILLVAGVGLGVYLVQQRTNIFPKAASEPISGPVQSRSVTVTYPNGGETLTNGSTVNITWNSYDIDGVYVGYIAEGAFDPVWIKTALPNQYFYEWKISVPTNVTKLKFRVLGYKSGSSGSVFDDSDNFINISHLTPSPSPSTVPSASVTASPSASLLPSPPPSPSPPPVGLVGYWRFDSILNDGSSLQIPDSTQYKSGSANLFGASITPDGRYLGAGYLEKGDYFEIPLTQALNLSNTDFTLATWVNLKDATGSYLNILGIDQKRGASSIITLGTRANGSALAVSFNFDSVDVPFSFPANTWVHLAARFNKTTKVTDIYVNGLKIGSGTHKGVPNIPSQAKWRIGKVVDYQIGTDSFSGLVDEVRIYNQAIPDGDIFNLARRRITT